MIEPTPGRIVWYIPSERDKTGGNEPPMYVNGGDPLAAIITAVHGPRCVNLTVFSADGFPYRRMSVQLLQDDGQDSPTAQGDGYATWMPYQKGQAAKVDAAILPAGHPVQQLADAIGGTIDHVERMPDGSGSAILSTPLPANHWLTQPGHDEPPVPFLMGTSDPRRTDWAEKIRAAARYAVRGATLNGTEEDFAPDAMVQNMVVGMLGYFTPDGLSTDAKLSKDTIKAAAADVIGTTQQAHEVTAVNRIDDAVRAIGEACIHVERVQKNFVAGSDIWHACESVDDKLHDALAALGQ